MTALLRALKPTPRGFRPSGRNHLLSTMGSVLASPEDPPVFWAFDGRDSGLVLPELPGWSTSGYSFAAWLRVEEFLGGSRIFSFLAENGAGFEACFARPKAGTSSSSSEEGDSSGFVIVLRSISQKGKDNFEPGSFVLHPHTWYHVAITHTSKTFSRSEVNVYANGVLVDTMAVKYPSLKHVPMTQCSIATNVGAIAAGSPAHSLHGQLGPGYIYARPLSPQDVAALYALGPARVVPTPLMASSTPWPASGTQTSSGLIFAFHPRAYEHSIGTTVYNLARNPESILDPEAHGALLRGSQVMSGTRLRHVFNAVGGLSILLPLFGQLDLPPPPSDPISLESSASGVSLTVTDGRSLFSLVAQLALSDPSAAAALASPPTIQLIGYLLTNCAPEAFGDIVLPSLTKLLDYATSRPVPPLRYQLLNNLLLPPGLWAYVPENALRARLALMSSQVKADPGYFRAVFGIGTFLDMISDAYLRLPEPALLRAHPAWGSGRSPPPRDPDTLRDARRSLLKAIKHILGSGPMTPGELEALARFMITTRDPDALVEIEQLVLVLISSSNAMSEFIRPTLPPPQPLVALFSAASRLLVGEASVQVGLFALKILLALQVRLAQSGSPKKVARFFASTGFGPPGLEPGLRNLTFSSLTYNILISASLGEVSLHLQEAPLSPGEPLVLAQLLPLVLELVASSPSARLKEQALQDMLLLVRHAPESRGILAGLPGWIPAVVSVMLGSLVNTDHAGAGGAAGASGDVGESIVLSSVLPTNVVYELGINVLFFVSRSAFLSKSGSAYLVSLYNQVLEYGSRLRTALAASFVHAVITSLFTRLARAVEGAMEEHSSGLTSGMPASSEPAHGNPFAEADDVGRGRSPSKVAALPLGEAINPKRVNVVRDVVTAFIGLVEEHAFAFPLPLDSMSKTHSMSSLPTLQVVPDYLPYDGDGRWLLYELAAATGGLGLAVFAPIPEGASASPPPVVSLEEGVVRGLGRLLLTALTQLDAQFPDDSRLMQLQNELLSSAVRLEGSSSAATVAVHDYSKSGELHRIVYDHLRTKLAARSKEARKKTIAFQTVLAQLSVLLCGTHAPRGARTLAPVPALSGSRKGVVCEALAYGLAVMVSPGSPFLQEDAIGAATLGLVVGLAALHTSSFPSLGMDVTHVDYTSPDVLQAVERFVGSVSAASQNARSSAASHLASARTLAIEAFTSERAQTESEGWGLAKAGSELMGTWALRAEERETQRRKMHCHSLIYDGRNAAREWAAFYRSLTVSTSSWAIPRPHRKYALDLRERPNGTRVRLVLDDSVLDHTPALIASRSHKHKGYDEDPSGEGASGGGGGEDESGPVYEAIEGLVLNTAYNPETGMSATPRGVGDEGGEGMEEGEGGEDVGGDLDEVGESSRGRGRVQEDSLVVAGAALITPFVDVPGEFELTSTRMFFRSGGSEAEEAVMSALSGYQASHVPLTSELLRDRGWDVEDVVKVHDRRVLLRWRGLEIFFADGSSVLLAFEDGSAARSVGKALVGLKPPGLVETHSSHAAAVAGASKVTEAWVRREISNFDYLMALNTFAGRSHHDLSQYPVFPWVLSDYESEKINLDDPEVYRDLSKPIGALDPGRLEYFEERFRSLEEADPTMPAFYYGSHYSSPGVVLYYLPRVEPYTTLAAHFNGGKFDHADRMFHSMATSFRNVMTSTADVKELIPEFYYLPEMFENGNGVDFGVRQDGVALGDVILPPWAGSAHEFVSIHRAALESEYVSAHLHEWIDLIFGYKQRGEEALEAKNVFHYMTYEGVVDLDAIDDEMQLAAAEAQIANFGQTPPVLFSKPHPRREARDSLVPRPFPRVNPEVSSEYLGPFVPVLAGTMAAVEGLVLRSPSTLRGTTAVKPVVLVMSADQNVSVVDVSVGADATHSLSVMNPSASPAVLGTFVAERIGLPVREVRRCVAVADAHASANAAWEPSLAAFPRVTRMSRNARARLDGLREVLVCAGSWDNALTVAGIGFDGSVKVIQRVEVGMEAVVKCLAVSSSGGILVTGCEQSQLLVWSLIRGELADAPGLRLCGHESGVVTVDVDASLGVTVSGAEDGRVLVHSLEDGEVAHELIGPGEGPVTLVAISSLSHLLTYHEESEMLRVFSLNGALLCEEELAFRASAFCVSRDGTHLFLANDATQVEVRSLPLLTLVHVYDECGVEVVGVVEVEEHLVVGMEDGRVGVVSKAAF